MTTQRIELDRDDSETPEDRLILVLPGRTGDRFKVGHKYIIDIREA